MTRFASALGSSSGRDTALFSILNFPSLALKYLRPVFCGAMHVVETLAYAYRLHILSINTTRALFAPLFSYCDLY